MWTTLLLLISANLVMCANYRWVLPIQKSTVCTGNPTCIRKISSRSPQHTYCQTANNLTQENCSIVSLTASSRVIYLLGVNGIRNEIALKWKIANMNRLHWNTILQTMAEKFVTQCSLDLDECTFIGKPSDKINICQNIAFISSTEDDRNPYGYSVRKWYSEYNGEDSSFEEFEVLIKEKGNGYMSNFVQMIWPQLELMGCASARSPQGIIVTCFFFPRRDHKNVDDFFFGRPCQNCPESRPTCSSYFKGLCGIDSKIFFYNCKYNFVFYRKGRS